MEMESLSALDTLAVTLFDVGAVQVGKFKQKGGKKSRIKVDLRLIVSYPDVLRQVAAAYRIVLDELKFDVLAAMPLAGLPIATALCLDMDRPLIYPRKTAKSYGTGNALEGVWDVGQTAVIIDDLITSGESILQTCAALKSSGLQVKDAVVLIDMGEKAVQVLRKEGYRVHSVLSIMHLLTLLQNQQRITEKEHEKVLKSLKK